MQHNPIQWLISGIGLLTYTAAVLPARDPPFMVTVCLALAGIGMLLVGVFKAVVRRWSVPKE